MDELTAPQPLLVVRVATNARVIRFTSKRRTKPKNKLYRAIVSRRLMHGSLSRQDIELEGTHSTQSPEIYNMDQEALTSYVSLEENKFHQFY